MTQLEIAESAGDKWDAICESDRALAEVLDKVFGRIEAGTQRYGQYENHARLVRVRVHGRDEEWTVVWQMDDSSEESVAWVLALEKVSGGSA